MPFTLSHPLAALVLRGTQLPLAAMVAGTMAPDLPLFLRSDDGYTFTHSLLGVVTGDLAIGLVGLAVWMFLVRDAVVDTAPPFVRYRLAAHAGYDRRQWALAPVAVLVGSLTHVGWDSFTHEGRWGVRHVAWLREQHIGLPGYSWAQAASSVIGLAAVLIWSAVAVFGGRRRVRPARVPTLAVRAPAVVAVVTAVAAVIGAIPYLPVDLHDAAFAGAVIGTSTLAISIVVVAAGWQLVARRSTSLR